MNTAPSLATESDPRWYARAADLPADHQVEQPWHTRSWARAWEQASPESIRHHHYLHLPDGPRPESVALHLTDHSPFWDRLLVDAATEVSWPGPVLYAGSLYGEYGGAGSASPGHIAATLHHGMNAARDLGACALVVPNLPEEQVALWQGYRPVGVPAPVAMFTDLSFTATMPASLEEFAAAAPNRHVARDMLRQHRRGTEAGLVLHALPGQRMFPFIDRFGDLACATADRHGTPLYTRTMFAHLAEVPGAVMLAAMHGGQLVGAFYSFVAAGRLHLWAAGIDTGKRHPYTYTWLMAESISYAARSGISLLDAGRSNCRYKSRHGLTGAPLHTLIYLTCPRPALASALLDMGERLERYAATGSPLPTPDLP